MEVGLFVVEEAGCWLALEVGEGETLQIAKGLVVVEVEEKAGNG